MPKSKTTPGTEPELLELEDFQEESAVAAGGVRSWRRAPLWLRSLASTLTLAILLVGSFELVYANKIYPGVTSSGVYVGGQSQTEAKRSLQERIKTFTGDVVTISHDNTNLRIPVAQLDVSYDADRAINLAYNYGREGTLWNRLRQQARALLGHDTNFSAYSYSDARLTPYLVELDDDITTPALDASLNFDDNRAQVTPAQSGTRLNLGRLTQLVSARLAQTSSDPIDAPVYELSPVLGTEPLQAAASQIDRYVSAPITLAYNGTERQIDQKTIISWIQVGSKPVREFRQTLKIDDLYPPPPAADLGLSKTAVEAYIAELAKGIDQTPRNAGLVMQDGHLTIAQPSRDGVKLDQAASTQGIIDTLGQPESRRVQLALQTTKPDVREDNLESLGIKELISEGETYFPGSPSTRLTNVRAGATRFNGVLLKPGEVFSFGALLGNVGPETGYVPELVILGDHEEKQYGGGLCQVSSTAFRAALAAGLPILERVNHAFAISYYTWPYAAPGVDATIYYPAVDFKFKNDTGHYILMQTTMQGYSLKFDFYGTKTKSGVIRGPEFISGSNDATKPSHTVFYRDVLDLAGNVTKTDKFDTWYKSSKDFPITQQFN